MENGTIDVLSERLLAPERADASGVKSGILLACTIVCEIVGTLLLKRAHILWCSALAFAMYFVALALFAFVLRTIPLAVAYTTWCACGTIGVSIGSSILYGEFISHVRWLCIVGTIPLVVGMYVG
jgi:multidrug transporter EmrE-like cation transporter